MFKIKSQTRQRCLEGANRNLRAPGSKERSSDPKETEPDLPVSVQESLAEVRVDSGLPRVRGTHNSPGSRGVLA